MHRELQDPEVQESIGGPGDPEDKLRGGFEAGGPHGSDRALGQYQGFTTTFVVGKGKAIMVAPMTPGLQAGDSGFY